MTYLSLGLFGLVWATSREDVLDNAAGYAIHSWVVTDANTTAECASDYVSDYTPGTYLGLPYDWGGYVSIAEFDAGIAAGDGAGSHSWHGILECTVGLDCSGFVSKVWEVGHYSTSTFDEIAVPIEWSVLRRADAVNDPGSHMVLFTHLSEGDWPVFYEASGGADRVHLNSDGGWAYLSGYQPIRLESLTDDVTIGTPTEPIVIAEVPYSDTRWTAGAASDFIDHYACAPEIDESGPEMYYRFEAPSPGWIAARVSDDTEVDVDVHVLTTPDGEGCVARGDTDVSAEVPAGVVWVVVDSYVGSREFPGPYILTVAFSVDPPQDDTGATDSDSTGGGGDSGDGADDGNRRDPPRAVGFPAPDSERPGCGCGTFVVPVVPGWMLLGVAWLVNRRRRSHLGPHPI